MLVPIPIKAREKLLESARERRQARADGNTLQEDYPRDWASGFFDALRCEYESATIGILVCEYDAELEADDDKR